jgi:hypothetical protein
MQFKIVSAGDYMTGENVHHYRRGIPKKFRNNYRMLVSDKVREVISDGDLFFLNFESALANRITLSSLPIANAVYIAPSETIDLLHSFDIPVIANIANNHFSQHGKEIAEYTIQELENNGVIVIGKSNEAVTIAKNGTIFRMWGVSMVPDKYKSGSYFESTYETLEKDLKAPAKEENEVRILSIHWGDEYNTIPNSKQKVLAKKLSDLGFDLLLGHHPHTIQKAEKIGDMWVFYSHGNFIFDQNFSSLTQKGLISKITFPAREIELFITQQKHFQVVDLMKVSDNQLDEFCNKNHSVHNSLKMRVKMKAELMAHFYELNLPIIKTFAGRLFG